jgi:hypothetical protein
VEGGRIRLTRGAHDCKGGHARVRRGRAQVGKETHMAGKGGVHGLWEGHTRVRMEARTMVAFTNFRM